MKQLLLIVAFLSVSTSYFAGGTFVTTGVTSTWSVSTTWSLSAGSDADGVPDSDDDVTINHSVRVTNLSSVHNVSIGAAGTLNVVSYGLNVLGPVFSNSGNLVGTSTLLIANGGTFSSSTVISDASIILKFNPNGSTRTISSGTTCSALNQFIVSGTGTVVNNGSLTIVGVFIINYGTLKNGSGGIINTKKDISLTNGGSFDATTSSNTVNFTGTTYSTILGTTYHNLSIDNGAGITIGSKTLGGNIVVNNSISLASNVQLNCNSKNVNCNGAWVNKGTSSSNDLSNTGGTFTFGGSSPSISRRTLQETFGNVVINSTGTLTMSQFASGYTGNFTCNDLTLTAGTIDFNAAHNYTLTVKGNLATNGGTLNQQTSGLIQFTGTSAQTIGGTSVLSFDAITISNASGVSTTSAEQLSSKGTLTVSSGTFTSNTADFTIISDATTSATGRVAALTTGSVAGTRWIIQRRIITSGSSSSTPYWDEFSSPVSGATLSDWDNEMYLSGVGGADGSASGFQSVKDWEGGTETSVTSLVALTPGKGFAIWTADDLNTLSPFTLDTRGTPNSGNISHACGAAGYFRCGNPYPSQIIWSGLTKTNVGDYFYCLDETIQDYATWDQSTLSGTSKLNGSNGIINSSQGFLVEATGAGSLQFKESAKTATVNNVFVKNNPYRTNRLSLHFSNDKNQVGMESSISFIENANNGKDNLDMGYPPLNVPKRYVVKTLTQNGDDLCSNILNISDESHEVPLVFIPAEAGNYSVSFEGLSLLNAYNCIILEDIASGKFIDLRSNGTYAFTVSNAAERRFVIHFKRTDGSAEACTIPSGIFKAIEANAPIAKVFVGQTGIVMDFYNKEAEKVRIVIYNSIGEIISNTEEYFQGQSTLEKPSVQGIYLVKLFNGKKTETHRIFVD